MADRPSWKDIDRMRDGSGRRRKKSKEKKELKEHSTRYDRYKADLNRLFDQGMAGELLRKTAAPNGGEDTHKDKEEAKASLPNGKNVLRRKGNGRIPKDSSKSASRFKLIRTIVDTQDSKLLIAAIDEMVDRFKLPDDWDVLIRVLEHPNLQLVHESVRKMVDLLPNTPKIPRRASLKERLRTIGQTAADLKLRELASQLEGML